MLLVIFDGHQAHQCTEAGELARANYVTLMMIPTHTSHHIQPLDITFFVPYKTSYAATNMIYVELTGSSQVPGSLPARG